MEARPQLKPLADGDDGSRVEAALAESPTSARRLVPRRLKVAGAIAAVCALAALALSVLGAGGGASRTAATAATAAPATPSHPSPEAKARTAAAPAPLKSHPRVVLAVPPGQAPPADAAGTSAPSNSVAQPPSDAEVRSELTQFRQHLTGYGAARGPVPQVRSDGTAVAPLEAPDVVATVIAAGNAIATTPYKWGGGHGAWRDTGYDCSGSISFALAGAGLMTSPLVAAQFMHFGASGPGRWITIYANSGHTFMVVAGLRFDTSGATGGTRWQSARGRSYAGFVARHPPGL